MSSCEGFFVSWLPIRAGFVVLLFVVVFMLLVSSLSEEVGSWLALFEL
mgnify:CR=1 FL=1